MPGKKYVNGSIITSNLFLGEGRIVRHIINYSNVGLFLDDLENYFLIGLSLSDPKESLFDRKIVIEKYPYQSGEINLELMLMDVPKEEVLDKEAAREKANQDYFKYLDKLARGKYKISLYDNGNGLVDFFE